MMYLFSNIRVGRKRWWTVFLAYAAHMYRSTIMTGIHQHLEASF